MEREAAEEGITAIAEGAGHVLADSGIAEGQGFGGTAHGFEPGQRAVERCQRIVEAVVAFRLDIGTAHGIVVVFPGSGLGHRNLEAGQHGLDGIGGIAGIARQLFDTAALVLFDIFERQRHLGEDAVGTVADRVGGRHIGKRRIVGRRIGGHAARQLFLDRLDAAPGQ